MSPSPQLAKAKRAALIVGTALPLLILLVSTVLQLAWLPRMPNPAAVHWGPSGLPDGFGSPWQNLGLFVGVNVIMLALPLVGRFQASRPSTGLPKATWASGSRFLPAFVLGMTVSMQAQGIGSSLVQLDAADARDTGSTLWVLIGGFAGGTIVGLVAFLLQPMLQLDPEAGEPAAEPLPLSGAERAVWVGEVTPSRTMSWVVTSTIVMLVALSVWMFTIEAVAGWITLGTLVFCAALMLMCMRFSVRIGAQGFEAKSMIGFPVFRVPAEDVASVVTAEINPLGEFGGWGLRFSGNRTGIVPRSGEGIVITKRDGRVLVATLAGAEEAAAVLSAAAASASTPRAVPAPDSHVVPRIAPEIEGDSQ